MASDGTVEYTKESFKFRKAAVKGVCLAVLTGPDAGNVFEIPPGTTVLGRSNLEALHSFTDPAISRRHAEIVSSPDGVEIRDLGSTNGVYVNGSRVSRAALQIGDFVTLSPVTQLRVGLRDDEVQALVEDLYHKAQTDSVTGVLTREAFLGRAAVTGEASLSVFDVDQMEHVKDHHGHRAGEQLLAQVADILKTGFAKQGLVGKSSEGFVALIRLRALEAKELLETLRRQVETSHFRVESNTGIQFLRATISVGVAELRQGRDILAVNINAEEALLKAKHMGRNRIELSSKDLWKLDES